MNASAAAAPDEGPEPAAVIPVTAGKRRARQREVAGGAWQVDGALALKAGGPGERLTVDPTTDPSLARTAVMVALGLLEVLSGWRPANQLSRWTSFTLQHDLERRAPRRPTGSRQQLLRLRVSEPSQGIAEVCAITHDPARRRVRVMALRLERRGQQWIVTRLQTG